MSFISTTKALLKFILNKTNLLVTNLKQFHFIYLWMFLLLYHLKYSYLSVDVFNNSCSLMNKAWYCSWIWDVTNYILLLELFIYWLISLSLLALYIWNKKNGLKFNEGGFLYVLVPYLFIRIISSWDWKQEWILKVLNDNYYIIWEYGFWLLLFSFLWFVLISWEKFNLNTKSNNNIGDIKVDMDKKEGLESTIYSNLPSILEKILYSSFKKSTFDSEWNKINWIVSIKEVIKKGDEKFFVVLNLHENLYENIWMLSKYDWTLWIESFWSISWFKKANWSSDSWNNGIILNIQWKRIDMSKIYPFPNLLQKEYFKNHLNFKIWIDEKGVPLVYDLASLPHLLVASETWGWKSVCLTNILVSLMKNKMEWSPIKFFIVDPKKVEFSIFKWLNWFKVTTDINKGLNMSRWLVAEMERRYSLLENIKVKNIKEYHDKWHNLDYIVYIVDEFADIMTSWWDNSKQFSVTIVRLTQLARAVWIHVILATQNPIGEVITSNIKANMTSRLWLRTSDAIKSRTIIDSSELANISYKGEWYMRTSDGFTHLKSYYIDNSSELPEFINIYKEKMWSNPVLCRGFSISNDKKEGVSLHLKENKANEDSGVVIHLNKNNNILFEFEDDIEKGIYHIDKHTVSYSIFLDILNDKWYKSKEELYERYKIHFIPKRTVERLVRELKEENFIKYDESNKINNLIGDITKDFLNEFYGNIYSVIQK